MSELVKTRIVFTKKDLEGHFFNNYGCPLARSLKRRLKVKFWVGGFNVYKDATNEILFAITGWNSSECGKAKVNGKTTHRYMMIPTHLLK